MQVERPAAERHRVGLRALFDNILLREHVKSGKPAALALSGNRARPFEGEAFGFGKAAGVLDIVPYSVDHTEQFVLHFLGVAHGVEASSVFNPPVFAAGLCREEIFRIMYLVDVALHFVDGQGEMRRHIAHGLALILDIEEDGMPQQLAVGGLVGRELLAELRRVFRSLAIMGA